MLRRVNNTKAYAADLLYAKHIIYVCVLVYVYVCWPLAAQFINFHNDKRILDATATIAVVVVVVAAVEIVNTSAGHCSNNNSDNKAYK